MIARVSPFALAVGEVAGVGAENFGRSLPQNPGRGDQRAVLLLRRRVGENARRGAGLSADGAHRGADVGFGLDHLGGGRHRI